jgi:hypothetical protein
MNLRKGLALQLDAIHRHDLVAKTAAPLQRRRARLLELLDHGTGREFSRALLSLQESNLQAEAITEEQRDRDMDQSSGRGRRCLREERQELRTLLGSMDGRQASWVGGRSNRRSVEAQVGSGTHRSSWSTPENEGRPVERGLKGHGRGHTGGVVIFCATLEFLHALQATAALSLTDEIFGRRGAARLREELGGRSKRRVWRGRPSGRRLLSQQNQIREGLWGSAVEVQLAHERQHSLVGAGFGGKLTAPPLSEVSVEEGEQQLGAPRVEHLEILLSGGAVDGDDVAVFEGEDREDLIGVCGERAGDELTPGVVRRDLLGEQLLEGISDLSVGREEESLAEGPWVVRIQQLQKERRGSLSEILAGGGEEKENQMFGLHAQGEEGRVEFFEFGKQKT